MEREELMRDVQRGFDYIFSSGESGWCEKGWDVSAPDAVGAWGRCGFFQAVQQAAQSKQARG